MKNDKLQEILDTYKSKGNKDLAGILLNLEGDFNLLKGVLLELSETLTEVETVYDAVYQEVHTRLNIKK